MTQQGPHQKGAIYWDDNTITLTHHVCVVMVLVVPSGYFLISKHGNHFRTCAFKHQANVLNAGNVPMVSVVHHEQARLDYVWVFSPNFLGIQEIAKASRVYVCCPIVGL